MKSKYLLVILFIVIALSGALLVFLVYRNSHPITQITINSSINNLEVNYKNKSEALNSLKNQDIIDDENIVSIQVNIVPSISTPILIQEDKEGNVLISSSYNIDSTTKTARIDISPQEWVLDLPKEEIENWIDVQFWEMAQLIMRQNTRSLRQVNQIPVILVGVNNM